MITPGHARRVDETYIRIGKTCKYLYRALDKEGNAIESAGRFEICIGGV
jgi:transposase-like protein